METTRKRRWWQFGLQAILLAMLVVGAFLAGWKACEMEYREDAESWRTLEWKYGFADPPWWSF